MGHMQAMAVERTLLETARQRQDLLVIAIGAKLHDTNQDRFDVLLGGRRGVLFIEDVGGRIDLNTASPALLEAMARAVDLPPHALEQLRIWRRGGLRLQSVEDVFRVTAVDPVAFDILREIATVHSGRTGVFVEAAPTKLTALIPERILRADFSSAATGATFFVSVQWEGAERSFGLGIIRVTQGGGIVLSQV